MKLWLVTVPASVIPFLSYMMDADGAGYSRLDLVNQSQAHDHLMQVARDMADHETWQIDTMAFRTGPEDVLRIDDPSFALDHFFLRDGYASARLRKAFALDPDEIAYRPVDTTHCFEAARARDYQAFLPLKVANPFDPARMPGHVRPVRQEDGSVRDTWMLDQLIPQPGKPVAPVWFRPDFVPPAPLFRPMGIPPWTLATEAFAARITQAGVTGIAFQEIEGPEAARKTIYRDPG